MKATTLAVVLAIGAGIGWTAREPQRAGVLDGTEDIVVQHPQRNAFGMGSSKTRVRLYGAGDEDFAPMPEGTSNATLWIVTINGINYRGVAQQ